MAMGGKRGRLKSIAQMKEEEAKGGKSVRGADLKVIADAGIEGGGCVID